MKKRICALLLSFSLFVLVVPLANAQNQKWANLFANSKISQNGLEVSNYKKVWLSVWVLLKDADQLGLTEERIRTRCEFLLRQAKLEVMGGTPEGAYLEVFVEARDDAFLIVLDFHRDVIFDAKGTTYRKQAVTWDKKFYGTCANDQAPVMSYLDNGIKSFLKEYLKVNKGKKK